MKTFAQLLTEFTKRAGVSDAELARHLGVRRQTIILWKEGLTQRPRDRQDVLRLADKLRLTPQERDELLLSAGFTPETPAAASPASPPAEDAPPATASPDIPPPPDRPFSWRWLLAGGVVLVVVLAMLLVWEMRNAGQVDYTASIVLGPTAAPDETLILIGQFANHGGEKPGYNVAGRLNEALRAQLDAAGMTDVRVQPIPEVIDDQEEAEKLGRAQNASLVIWGEYEGGQVLAHVTPLRAKTGSQEVRLLLDDATDLSVTINSDLTDEVRWLALVALGETAYLNGDTDRAEKALRQALQQHPPDAEGLDLVHFYLGLALNLAGPEHWDDALAELHKAHDLAPDSPGVNNALCWTYALAQQPQKALPFCDRAVELDASGASHDSRGVARAQLDDYEGAIADFQYVLDHLPDSDQEASQHYTETRQAWIKALQAGENPFDEATLQELAGE